MTTTVRDSGQVKVSPLTIYNIDDQDGRQCFIIRGAEQISAGVRLSLSNEGVPTTAGLGSNSVPMLVSTTIPAPPCMLGDVGIREYTECGCSGLLGVGKSDCGAVTLRTPSDNGPVLR